MEKALTAVMMKDLEKGMADAQAMQELGTEMQDCSKDLEKKYDQVYTSESEDEVIEKILSALKAKDGCEFTYAIMKMGAKEMKK
jgi:hypothetical protein